MPQPQSFSASTVVLQGSNLIEASAGTGKTYSIAILVLRLILEKKISIKEILMVTFTKAAVAELEERIRLFVRSAYKVSMGEAIKDQTITAIVKGCEEQTEARKLLQEAVLFLDETSVLTIHSFCQKTLNEFAFETNQLFGAETLKDLDLIIETEINKFWRQQVTAIPSVLLGELIAAGLKRESIKKVLKEHLSGKKYNQYSAAEDYSFNEQQHTQWLEKINEVSFRLENTKCEIANLEIQEPILLNKLLEKIANSKDSLRITCIGNKSAEKNVLPHLENSADFLNCIISKKSSGYIKDLFGDILDENEKLEKEKKKLKELKADVKKIIEEKKYIVLVFITQVNSLAIQHSIIGIETYKQRNNQMSFDDMIVKLHEALKSNKYESLVKELQNKYKAVFVDEFQDTDKLQYEIFQKAFSTNTILFYIGDPKQSIYAFRKADIFTYFNAYNTVGSRYEMNTNFRSSKPMIEAMNVFFKPTAEFDTFSFIGEGQSINYINVDSPDENKKGLMRRGPELLIPITIITQNNNDSILDALAAQVVELLTNTDYNFGEEGKEKPIKPSDIGILVRTNRQSREVKDKLAFLGIPAVTIGDDKVLESDEAKYLLYLLEAINDTTKASINKALLTSFTGFSTQGIIQLNDEKSLELFKKYKSRWDDDGIYTALMDFVADFKVQQNLLQDNTENGERAITNLYHLIELVHKIQTGKMLSSLELISWLKRGVEGMEIEGDEYEQRVESDEEAVKIVTIHKSKGLEYKIVIAPYLDFVPGTKDDIRSYRDKETGEYISFEKKMMTDEQKGIFLIQMEQEYRRLLYVSITRAVYKCYIYRNSHYRSSTLATFTNALVEANIALIEQNNEPVSIPENYRYTDSNPWSPLPEIKEVHFSLIHQNWTKMSYTMLAAKHDASIKNTNTLHEDEYNKFVFHQLAKGEKTGNLLHAILETINYSNSDRWNSIIETAISRFAPGQRLLYEKMLPEMIRQILQANIQLAGSSFKLADVTFNKRIHEFEFDFPVASFSTDELNDFSDENMQVNVKSLGKLEGIMNGKIDLFFEHDGKYFILDWKSNFLGDALEDYSAAGVANAMNENNYHLQYLIYTVAVKKYLESRLPGFDYERDFGGVIYIFMRGVRKNLDKGMFVVKPASKKIALLEKILKGVEEEEAVY
jgi:exodeoxyribonuclease V beta subunit